MEAHYQSTDLPYTFDMENLPPVNILLIYILLGNKN